MNYVEDLRRSMNPDAPQDNSDSSGDPKKIEDVQGFYVSSMDIFLFFFADCCERL